MSGVWIYLVVLLPIHHSHAVFWSQQFLQSAFTPAHYNFTESVKLGAPQCIEEYQTFVRGLYGAEPWAQRVLDSWSLTTSGLFSGNQYSYGHFDQCLESSFKSDESQYCLITAWKPNINAGFWNGVCLPKSCPTQAVQNILTNLYPNFDLSVHGVVACSTRNPAENPIVSKAIHVFLFVVILAMLSTAYHLYFGSKKKLLTSFSLVRNARSLFDSSKGGHIEFLDGFRVLAMLGIFGLHMITAASITTKADASETFKQEWWYNFIYSGHLSVHTFFVIGGFVMSLKILRLIDQKKSFNVLKFFINRYVRLTAPVGFLILFAMAFYSSVQGPNTVDVNNELSLCEGSWWTNLLHLQGYLKTLRCLGHTWYVAVDAHLCLFAPVLFLCLKKYSTKFVVSLTTVIVMVSFPTLILHKIYSFDYDYHYFLTHTRMSPWFIGILLGLAVHQFQSRNRKLSLQHSRAIVIASSAAIMTIFYSKLFENVPEVFNYVYFVVLQFLFAIAVSSIIFALANEPKGQASFLTNFLSHQNFHFLSKLTFSFYLLHIPVIRLLHAINRNPVYLTEMTLFMESIVCFWVTILASIPFTLLFEMPFVNLCSALLPE